MRQRSEPVGVAGVAALVVLAVCGLLSGVLECLLVPLYAGTVIVPIAVPLAVVGNVALPLLAWSASDRLAGAALPMITWLIAVFGFGATPTAGGDVVLPGAPTGAQWCGYSMMLTGAFAGAGVVAWLSLRVPAQSRYQARGGANPGGGSTR